MNFEKVDLFCPKCGKYSVVVELPRSLYSTDVFNCVSCNARFEFGFWAVYEEEMTNSPT